MKLINFNDKAYQEIMKEFEENIENQVFHEELYNFYMNKFEAVTALIDDALFVDSATNVSSDL